MAPSTLGCVVARVVTSVLAMPAWHSKQYGRGNAGSYQSSSSHQSWQSGKGYGKGSHYGKGFGNPYRASPTSMGGKGAFSKPFKAPSRQLSSPLSKGPSQKGLHC